MYSIYFNRIGIKQVVTRASGEKLHHFVTSYSCTFKNENAYVRNNLRHRNSKTIKKGARGPFGRNDNVPDWNDNKDDVGNFLRLATGQ